MAITQNTYTGNGSTVLYSFSFPYLETTDVKVSLNGTVTTAYTFANATTIQFNTAPANGAAIRIYRETDDTALQAVLSPGSSIRASDLNDNFDQLIYLGQEANTEADSATATANTALTNSATAISTANTASTNASAAVSTANTASANASAAVSTANTASTNASTAVSTANTASTNASTALSTANAATTTANNAVTTANTASSTASTALTNANAAVSTANTASTNASNAVTTANTASANASSAVTTANNAVTTANSAVITAGSAVTTANSAVTTANAAAAAVANAVLYTTVANVAAIPVSPANNTAIEVTNSTGIESFTPLSGLPAGFVGSSGLSVRIIYQTVGSTWTWIQYFPNDPENRYFKLSGGTITGPITVPQGTVSSPGVKFSGTGNDNTGVYSPGIDELGLVTNGTARLTIDSAGSVSIPGTLGVTGAITGSLTGAASSNVLKAGDTMTGALVHPLGAAATPSITFTGDTNTGIYSPGADQVAISTNGTGRLFVDASGNVRISSGSSWATSDATFQLGFNSNEAFATTYFDAHSITVGAGTSYKNKIRISGTGADNNITFHVGASSPNEKMRLDSSGRLGLGTSSPQVLLHGTTSVSAATEYAGVGFLENSLNNFDTGATVAYPVLKLTRAGKSGISFRSSAQFGIARYEAVGTAARTRLDIALGHGDVAQPDTTVMSLLSSGAVGIGTTSPGRLLTLDGGASGVYLQLTNTAAGSSAPNGFEIFCDGTNAGLLNRENGYLAFDTNSLERARITSSGQWLVGTSTAPSTGSWNQYAKIVNTGTTNNSAGAGVLALNRNTAATSITATNAIGVISFGDSAGNEFGLIQCLADANAGTNDYPGVLTFSTTADGASSPTERARITSGGYFKVSDTGSYISATGNGHEFLMNNNFGTYIAQFRHAGATTGNQLGIEIILSGDPNGTGNEFWKCTGNTTLRALMRSNGGLANYSANNLNLSDRNVKKDISPAAGTWDCIKEWEIVNFRYKDQPDNADLNMGVIAQQVAESCPEAVTVFEQAAEDQPEKLGVKEQQMMWMAIKALQEAQVRIETLEAEVAALKAA
jgi:hypothetical protein